jgi:hypothetical protein
METPMIKEIKVDKQGDDYTLSEVWFCALSPKGLIFITAGLRPAEYTAIYFCLKGRTKISKYCLSGRVVEDVPVRRSRPAVMKIKPFGLNTAVETRRRLVAVLMALALLAACDNNGEPLSGAGEALTLFAQMDAPLTRATATATADGSGDGAETVRHVATTD